MSLSYFETYVQSSPPEIRVQILHSAMVPAFRDALVCCIRSVEEYMLGLDPHQEPDDSKMMKVYRQLYNERALYQDFLSGIEKLRRKAVEEGILPETSAPDLRSVEDVDLSEKTA